MISDAKRKFLLLTDGREAGHITAKFNARTIQACKREGLVEQEPWPAFRLTEKGRQVIA